MSDPDLVADALRWLQSSHEDLRSIGVLRAAEPPLAVAACFHAQQAAEKALKAILVLEGRDVPFTHDLLGLQRRVQSSLSESPNPEVVARLNRWGSESRYPGDDPDPTPADAALAEVDAADIYNRVAAEFARRGLNTVR